MTYQVTARKWRPMVFEDVVGQSHITSTLRNAIATNRLAHSYIFSGQRGCGKTTTARILAKAINCLSPKDVNPDNTCEICQEITKGRSLDVIEIDGASNRGVEEIRNLRESVRYTPSRGKYKVYIIDEVHMLTKEAFNALLKTLEEPPPQVIFIFATTEVHKVPLTILSRCQRFDFRRIGIDEIVGRLRFIASEENVKIDDGALMVVAKKGDGSLRDAQSIFDQVRSFCGNEIATADVLNVLNAVDQEVFFRLTDLIKAGDVRGGIELVDEIVRTGYDLREFLGGVAEHFRNLLIARTTNSTQLIETSEPYKKKYEREAGDFKENDLLRLIKLANELEQSIRWASQPRFKLEAGLLQMIKMDKSVQIEELLRQLDELKKKLEASLSTVVSRNDIGGNTGVEGSEEQKQTSEVKVLGSVSAGRLRYAAAPSYQTKVSDAARHFQPISFKQEKRPDLSSSFSSEPSPPRTKVISAEDAFAQWQRWISEVRKEKISIGTALGESRILDIHDGALRISCPDEYHLASLKRHKEFLVESFEKVTGCKMRIEPVVHASERKATPIHPHQNLQPQTTLSSEESNSSPVSLNEHPVIAALKRELGAELVQ